MALAHGSDGIPENVLTGVCIGSDDLLELSGEAYLEVHSTRSLNIGFRKSASNIRASDHAHCKTRLNSLFSRSSYVQ